MEYLTLNYSQEIKFLALAELAGLSVSFFPKQFKAETKATVFQHIAHLRCTHAAELLRSTDSPIQDISGFVGYPDNNYFVKVFRKEYGMTPSEYRLHSAGRSEK